MKFFIAASCNNGNTNGLFNSNSLPQTCANQQTLTDTLNIIFAIVGALAFLMLVIAGLRYILSGGDANKVAESRRMILYAVIGIIIVALAAAIVNFVIGKL